jgi:hypothetical protein
LLSKRNYYAFLALVPIVLTFRLFGIVPGIITALAGMLAIGSHVGLFALSPSMVFVVGAGVVALLLVLIFAHPAFRRPRALILVKLAAIGGIAMLVVVPRVAADIAQHGSLREKDAAMMELAEKLAKAEYRPSKIYSGDPDGYYGSALKAKGLQVMDIMRPPWRWHVKIFESATGVYGWLEFRSPRRYYYGMALAYLALFACIAWGIARAGDRLLQVESLAAGGFSVALIAVAAYFSWISDFQAQGRYLFPILTMLSLVLQRARHCVNERACLGIAAFCFLLSCWSFVFVGLVEIPKGDLFRATFP